MAQLVKNPPAMQEAWVLSPDWEDPLEKGKATHFWPGKLHGLSTLWGHKESDMTATLTLHLFKQMCTGLHIFLTKQKCYD